MSYKAEGLDQAMYIAEKSSDQQIRCYIEFDACINENVLKKALTLCVNLENILLHQFKVGWFGSDWINQKDNFVKSIFTYIEDNHDALPYVNSFLTEKIDTCNEPQMQVALL